MWNSYLKVYLMLNGYLAAVVSPFKNNSIDINAFEKYINHMILSGITGIVVCGSSGESLSLTVDEKVALIRCAYEMNEHKIKIFAGIIETSTKNCLDLMAKTEQYVDGFLCVCPYYTKPSQAQIFAHFSRLGESTEKSIILYNNPSRVGTSIDLENLKQLAERKNIIAIKECSADISRFTLCRKQIREDFSFLVGNDDLVCAALAMGASGVISVSVNVIPSLCNALYDAFTHGNMEKFSAIRDSIAECHTLMFKEPSPGPVKYGLSKLGLISSDELREPLSTISAKLKREIDEFFNKHGIMNDRI